MRTKVLVIVTLILVTVSLILAGCSSSAAPTTTTTMAPKTSTPAAAPTTPVAQQLNWRLSCGFGVSDSAYQIDAVGGAKLLEQGSGGKIKVQTFPDGQIVGGDDLFGAVGSGSVEVGANIGASVAGIIPEINGINLPIAAQDYKEFNEIIYKYGLIDKIRPSFVKNGVYLLGIQYAGEVCLQSTFDCSSLDSLKGKKDWSSASMVPGMVAVVLFQLLFPALICILA